MKMRNIYPAPYINEETWNDLHQEIESLGFQPDPFLKEEPRRPVYGLNLALGWPLPSTLKEPYERLVHEISGFGPDIYVYHYQQTHITVMTFVNFKDHQNPTAEEVCELQRIVPEIVSILSPFFSADSALKLKPFKIDVGPPVLSSRAAFLPILNPTREVSRLRDATSNLLKQKLLSNILVPKAIHSTILRFIKCPNNVRAFVSAFESKVANLRLGTATIDEFLLIAETKPYMIDGKILHRFSLKE